LIVDNDVGNVTDVNDIHPTKALALIVLTPVGMMIDVNDVHL